MLSLNKYWRKANVDRGISWSNNNPFDKRRLVKIKKIIACVHKSYQF